MSHHENISRIKAVYNALGPLKDKVVFVGGATVSLYRERDWPEVRITEDVDYTIDPQHTIKIFSAPYFLAAKLDAFLDRGHGDGRTSSDFEDIVFLLEHRSAIWKECEAAPLEVRTYLKTEFKKLLTNLFLEEWIDAHIDFRSPPSTDYIIEQLREFVHSPTL
jgi:hypothetical protein